MGYIRVYLGDALKDQFALNTDRLTIGRARDNDLVLNDPGVSSHHAAIVREGHRFYIEDNESTNGVYLNNERISKSELKYWDEIQIYNHVLKFMALSALKEGGDPDMAEDRAMGMDRTRIVNLSQEDQLKKLRSRKKSAFVSAREKDGSERRLPFKKVTFSIGRSRDCDIRTGGWFAPKQAAELERSADGYYLIPHSRGRVTLNGESLTDRGKLEDGDEFEVRDLSLRFVHKVMGE